MSVLHARREWVFLLLAGVFLGCLTMLNIIGISRFIVLGSYTPGGGVTVGTPGAWTFAVAAGVLPYPLTFLCTDLISEFYGRRRANWVVLVGVLLNALVVVVLWLATSLPGFGPVNAETGMPPLPVADPETGALQNTEWALFWMKQLAFGAVVASMIAYLAAQLCDVWLFHFWKRVTKGRMLWLRNNGSTLVSQLVDTTAVILITHFYANALPISDERGVWPQLMTFIATGYVFKFVMALLDTPVIYAAVAFLKGYLEIDPVHQTVPLGHIGGSDEMPHSTAREG
jgi:uncharacterized PurR-regulated membrane protein YhhQ (DUF165 family)